MIQPGHVSRQNYKITAFIKNEIVKVIRENKNVEGNNPA